MERISAVFLCFSIALAATGKDLVPANKNKNEDPRALRLEYPKLKSGRKNLLIVHTTADYGINFSLEWNCRKKANRWTCYEMYDGNTCTSGRRTNTFREDKAIPKEYRTTLSQYAGSGFSRGHLCPSADRLCSREQNDQTFLLSNMQPQYQKHNGGLWSKLEAQVRKWNNAAFRDTLYVVKAATIDHKSQTYGYTKKGLLIPKFFYMAVLCKKGNTYKAIGIWTEHKNERANGKQLAQYAISIDELEQRTGIDFFCNLPDEIEDRVERELIPEAWGLK